MHYTQNDKIRQATEGRQIQKFAGLAIVVNESGKQKGQSEISRRGRKRLRRILFQAAMCLVKNNQEFKQIHEYLTLWGGIFSESFNP